MSWNLTVNFTLPNGHHLDYPKFVFDEEVKELSFTVELRTSNASGARLVTRVPMVIRDGLSDQLSRQDVIPAGTGIDDWTAYFKRTQRTTATGYTDAKAAERAAANSPSARRTAMEAHVASAGHIDATLAGS